MSAIAFKTAPTIEDVLMAADTVDTIRHEMAIQETEILSEDRRAALKTRLRQYYDSQGIEVANEIIERAVEDMDKNRYVHQPLKPGFSRLMARMWIKRGAILKNVTIGIVSVGLLVVATSAIHERFVLKPRERAAAELKLDLETRIPQALEAAHTQAVALAEALDDEVALSRANSLHEATLKFLEAEKIADAKDNIRVLNEHIEYLKIKTTAVSLNREYDAIKDEIALIDMDRGARLSLDPMLKSLDELVYKGDTDGFERVKKKIAEQLHRIQTPVTLRVVDRSNVRSGVWRTQDNNRTKIHYLIVEAVDQGGASVAFPIRNYETGKTETVDYWGVRVPEELYNKVALDKQEDGVIDDAEVGTKPSGSIGFRWSISQLNNQMITRW